MFCVSPCAMFTFGNHLNHIKRVALGNDMLEILYLHKTRESQITHHPDITVTSPSAPIPGADAGPIPRRNRRVSPSGKLCRHVVARIARRSCGCVAAKERAHGRRGWCSTHKHGTCARQAGTVVRWVVLHVEARKCVHHDHIYLYVPNTQL